MKMNHSSRNLAAARILLHTRVALLALLSTSTTHAWSQRASLSPTQLTFCPQVLGGFGSTPTRQAVTVTNTCSSSLLLKSILVGDNVNNVWTRDYGTTSLPKMVTVTNWRPQTFILSMVTTGDFQAVGTGTNPCSGGLEPGASCTLQVSFTLHQSGPISGSVAIAPYQASSYLY